MMRSILLIAMLLGGCTQQPATADRKATSPATGLEAAAIEAGVIADPMAIEITGLYARETDRVCIVPNATAYRIGVFVDYGDNQNCGGSGTVTRVGEMLHLELADGCSFDARFEGDRIVFPGRVPEACGKLCSKRVSFAALEVDRLSDSVSEASTLRDGRGKLLCGGGR